MANLLDAGMRNVGLVMDQLRGQALSVDSDPVARLETVSQTLELMARLLRRWTGDAEVHSVPPDRTFGQTTDYVVKLFGAIAGPAGIQIRVNLCEDTASLPAGPVYSIVANAIQNSIEAISESGRSGGEIEVFCQSDGQEVFMRIEDNGPGLAPSLTNADGQFHFGVTTKPSGHGIGLGLSRKIARKLNGQLDICDRPSGGVVLTLRYPI